jgi:hypothetical protein
MKHLNMTQDDASTALHAQSFTFAFGMPLSG